MAPIGWRRCIHHVGPGLLHPDGPGPSIVCQGHSCLRRAVLPTPPFLTALTSLSPATYCRMMPSIGEGGVLLSAHKVFPGARRVHIRCSDITSALQSSQ